MQVMHLNVRKECEKGCWRKSVGQGRAMAMAMAMAMESSNDQRRRIVNESRKYCMMKRKSRKS